MRSDNLTIEQLKSYRVNLAYCTDLEADIRDMCVKDSVSSASSYPYSKHTVTVSGLPPTKKAADKQKELDTVRLELLKVESFISNISDNEMRYILTQKYIKGKTNLYIAMKLGYCDESTVRKKIKKYFQNSDFSDFDVV